jgi:uncharacterized Zn-finger protein
MADHGVPHFHNDPGVAIVRVGSKRFMCMGAKAPFDHPHVFLDMGAGEDIVCPYCSTLYKHDATLGPNDAEPKACVHHVAAA